MEIVNWENCDFCSAPIGYSHLQMSGGPETHKFSPIIADTQGNWPIPNFLPPSETRNVRQRILNHSMFETGNVCSVHK